MELRALIDEVKAGDVYAFTELVRRYQDLAFGYAYAILRDFHLAQDAAQEAFVVTYADIGKLQDAGAFPGWLRSVVRHQCGRILRKRVFDLVPLDQLAEVSATTMGPEEHVEKKDALDGVIEVVNALPQAQREVVALYYIKEYSQQEVAAFLELPLTTVNDRLPALLSALTITDPERKIELTVGVAQQLGDGVVRCVVLSSTTGLVPGMDIVNTGNVVGEPVTRETLGRAVDLLGGPAGSMEAPAGAGEVLETGIKAIDLLCPYRKGGKAAILGPMGVGKLVGIEEVVHNVASRGDGLSLFTFFRPGNEASSIQEEIGKGPAAGTVQTILLAADDPQDPVPTTDAFDAVTYMTRDLAVRGLYPAVDPLRSTSRLLDPSIVGVEHFDIARRVRETLQRAKEIESVGADLSEEEKLLVSRAHKIELFFTQPFFVAEPYTNRPGQYVSREETVKAFGAILAGAYDDLPEEAFQWCGTIEQAIEKMKSEARSN